MAVKTVQLFGVAAVDGDGNATLAPDTSIVSFRDLGAVVAEAPYVRATPDEREIARHRAVVDAVFEQRPVLPAPVGVIFRTPESLLRWMEVHYIVLSEGLAFVEGRCVARVHMHAGDVDAADADLIASATESFKALRRQAVAAVPLKEDPRSDAVMSVAYLVARDRWAEFSDLVAEEARRRPELRVSQTGPWPPYDFVRMQFGA
jgi:hypothetical protein